MMQVLITHGITVETVCDIGCSQCNMGSDSLQFNRVKQVIAKQVPVLQKNLSRGC